ncbi:MAG: PAS domain-containing protein [Planctomycetota bacterium]
MTMESTREDLLDQIHALETTVAALLQAAEREGDGQGPTALLGQMVHLDDIIAEKTWQLRQALDENRRLAENLRAGETLLRATLNSMDSHIAILDLQGQIIETNLSWAGFAHLRYGGRDCRMGSNYLDACHMDEAIGSGDSKNVEQAVRKVLAGKSVLEVVEYRFDLNERPYWYQVRVTPRGSEAKLEGAVVSHTDVTARYLAALEMEAQRKWSERLALVARYTSNGVIISDPQGRIEWINEGFTRLSGYSLEDVLGKRPGEVLQGPETSPETRNKMAEGLKAGTGFDVEVVNYRKNGEAYWVAVEVRPLFNEDGELVNYMAMETEVTERLAMQREIAAERSLLMEIINTIPYFVFWKDLDGRYGGANRAFAGMGGLTPQEIVGKDDYEMPWAALAEDYRRDDKGVSDSGVAKMHIQETVQNADGTVSYVDTSKMPLRSTDGKVVGVLGIFADMTEQRALEAQLAHASKLESIGQLAAGIAHEINTPTQYVGDNTRFLMECYEDATPVFHWALELHKAHQAGEVPEFLWDKLRKSLDQADLDYLIQEVPQAFSQSLSGIDRVRRIVQAMKEFSHPGSGEKTSIDLNREIESTITVAMNEWKYVADMVRDFDLDLPRVICLPGEFNQVVLNIIVNAAHAIQDKVGGTGEKGAITLQTRVEGEFVVLRISDTGGGIPEGIRNKIFDPFFTTKEVGRGTGQGLAIAHNVIVNKLGGKIDFQSEMGVGTTFIIQLPLHPQVNG